MTGDPIGAEDAAGWGLIWKCVDDDQLQDEALALAMRFAAGPPAGYAATKQAIRQPSTNSLTEELIIERDLIRALGGSEGYQEGVAAFIAMRRPVFKGR